MTGYARRTILMMGAGLVSPQDSNNLGEQIGQRLAQQTGQAAITVRLARDGDVFGHR